MGTCPSSQIISHHARPGFTQGPWIQLMGTRDPAHGGPGSSSRGLGSSSWGPGIRFTGAWDLVHRGLGSSSQGLGLPPAGGLDISAKRSVFTQKGRGARRGTSARPDSWFSLMTVPSGSLPRGCSLCCVFTALGTGPKQSVSFVM